MLSVITLLKGSKPNYPNPKTPSSSSSSFPASRVITCYGDIIDETIKRESTQNRIDRKQQKLAIILTQKIYILGALSYPMGEAVDKPPAPSTPEAEAAAEASGLKTCLSDEFLLLLDDPFPVRTTSEM
jgi:hypothetical protein